MFLTVIKEPRLKKIGLMLEEEEESLGGKKEQVELEPVPLEVLFGEVGVLHLQLGQKVLIRRKLIKRCINQR